MVKLLYIARNSMSSGQKERVKAIYTENKDTGQKELACATEFTNKKKRLK